MCQVPSWITTSTGVLFTTDKDAKAHKIDWVDATGHSAIRRLWPKCKGVEGEGLGRHTPKVVVDALLSGKMAKILGAGELLVTDGEWSVPCTSVGGNVSVWKGGTLTLPLCKTVGDYVYVSEGATLTLPACTSVGGNVYVGKGATLSLPVCKTVGGNVDVRKGGTLTLPVCKTVGGYVDVGEGGKLVAPKLKR
jgi:hypothetical protein